jgi:hypothetical protein
MKSKGVVLAACCAIISLGCSESTSPESVITLRVTADTVQALATETDGIEWIRVQIPILVANPSLTSVSFNSWCGWVIERREGE